jgi:hypothetical protein
MFASLPIPKSASGRRVALIVQAFVTLAILISVPSNAGKLTALLALWAVTFGKLTRTEWVFFAAISVFFTAMNAAALAQGIFTFSDPDFLRMPVWEVLMWGFYTLHTIRLLGGPIPNSNRKVVWGLAILFAAAFATIPDSTVLLAVTSVVLLMALGFFHDVHDLAYAGYMILLGAAVEYAGVYAGLWSYPGDPSGGVPLWFITMWGGVGLFLRRLALPIVSKHDLAQ